MEAIHAFWNSPDYIPIKKLREGVATLTFGLFRVFEIFQALTAGRAARVLSFGLLSRGR